jgi:TonB family protein
MKRALLAAALAFLAITPAQTATKDAASHNWRVERGSLQCSLVSTRGPKFTLQLDDSAGLATLFAVRLGSSEFQTTIAEIMLLPSGSSFLRDKGAMWMPGGLAVFGLPRNFMDEFARSAQMQIKVGGKKKFDFALGSVSEAVSTLRSCHLALLRSWGVNPDQLSALSKQPEPLNESEWLRQKDVEEVVTEAMVRHGGGTTALTFTVQPDGHVRDCRTVVSSGLPTLDSLACASILKNARYEPGVDAGGRPVPVKIAYLRLWAFSRP